MSLNVLRRFLGLWNQVVDGFGKRSCGHLAKPLSFMALAK
jgi:hypothetical protein